jgi:hypothetical protein
LEEIVPEGVAKIVVVLPGRRATLAVHDNLAAVRIPPAVGSIFSVRSILWYDRAGRLIRRNRSDYPRL